MTTSISRRICVSALVLAATAAIGLGGSTEAWGQTSTPSTQHDTTTSKTSAWSAPAFTVTTSKTSAWS